MGKSLNVSPVTSPTSYPETGDHRALSPIDPITELTNILALDGVYAADWVFSTSCAYGELSYADIDVTFRKPKIPYPDSMFEDDFYYQTTLRFVVSFDQITEFMAILKKG
jgi:hypothetical protein